MAGLLGAGYDFAQGASNAAASNVSGPVDGIAWLLRKAGLKIPENAVGSSQWMAEQGLTRQPENKYAGLLGEAAGLLAPAAVAAKAPSIAAGLLQGGENLAAPSTMRMTGQRGAILYHGTNDSRPLQEIQRRGPFEGLFTSPSEQSAASHGDAMYRFTVPDEQILTQHALDSTISERKAIAAVKASAPHLKGVRGANDLAELVRSGGDVWGGAIPEDQVLKALRVDDLGEASWELQRLRGKMAEALGYKGVEMPDEHGVSYWLAPGAASPRPANEAAAKLARGGK